MNPIRLQEQGGNAVDIWLCSNCRLHWTELSHADNCCCCIECRKPIESESDHARKRIHDDCRRTYEQRERSRLIENATEVQDYNGWVYVEGYGYNEGFFEGIDELLDHLDAEPEVNWPEWAFCCEEIPFPHPHYTDVMESYLDDHHEGVADSLAGTKEFQNAIDEFCEKNQNLKSYFADHKRKVRVPSRESIQ